MTQLDQAAPSVAATPKDARVIVRARRARPLFARHPWLFATSVERVEGLAEDGGHVTVHAHDGQFIAHGLYNSQSQIRVRLYSWDPARPPDEDWWRERLTEAVELRTRLALDDPAGACRLVFSESDGLSGLVVDRYGPWLVLQLTSLALAQRLDLLVRLLVELCRPRGIYLRTERGIGQAEGLQLRDGPLWGEQPEVPVLIEEQGICFEVDVRTGQKTGFYLDQRENRRAAARYAAGRRVLDVFCYTGAFALAAARAGAAEVLGVDASAAALEAAARNAERNGISAVRFERGDAFETLERLAAADQRYGLIILDPPKFARHARSIEDACRGYRRANLRAVRLLEPGGILVSCSCSGHVRREHLLGVLGSVAEETGRSLRVLEQLGQPPDHPVAASCPETEYLKGLIVHGA